MKNLKMKSSIQTAVLFLMTLGLTHVGFTEAQADSTPEPAASSELAKFAGKYDVADDNDSRCVDHSSITIETSTGRVDVRAQTHFYDGSQMNFLIDDINLPAVSFTAGLAPADSPFIKESKLNGNKVCHYYTSPWATLLIGNSHQSWCVTLTKDLGVEVEMKHYDFFGTQYDFVCRYKKVGSVTPITSPQVTSNQVKEAGDLESPSGTYTELNDRGAQLKAAE